MFSLSVSPYKDIELIIYRDQGIYLTMLSLSVSSGDLKISHALPQYSI